MTPERLHLIDQRKAQMERKRIQKEDREALQLIHRFRDKCWRLIASPHPTFDEKKSGVTFAGKAAKAQKEYDEAKADLFRAITGRELPRDHNNRG